MFKRLYCIRKSQKTFPAVFLISRGPNRKMWSMWLHIFETFYNCCIMPVQTRAQRRQRSRAVNEAGLDKVWALIGVQSLLCTLAFLALLYLNFQIWHQYFFLILWAFILSHAFKAALDDLQAWADDLANGVAQASRKEVLCRCCWGLFHRHDQRASPEQQHTSLLQGK